MARLIPNSALGAIYGTIDGMVYRRHRGKLVVYPKPRQRYPRAAGQLATQDRFGAASAYARQIAADPILLARYRTAGRKRRLNYRQMALRDFFNAPRIVALDTSAYNAVAGGPLFVVADDDFEVIAVAVALRAADSTLIAAGQAAMVVGRWRFQAPAISPGQPPPRTIDVTAHDRPGNATHRVFELP